MLTPLLLRRSWNVTSIIRTQEQVPAVRKLAEEANEPKNGKLSVLVRSIEDVRSEADAQKVLDEVQGVDYVVWSAGAAGRGGPERTYAIDRDAAIYFIRASASTPCITRFLLVSYLGSRRAKPDWWSDEEWKAAEDVNNNALPHYYKAKLAADEELYRVSKEKGDKFVGIDLRPGTLTLDPPGKVELGKTKESRGNVSRASVAHVADALLAAEGVKNSWIDLLDGEEEIEEAVSRVVKQGADAAEGENL